MITGAGADAIIGHLSVATLDPGDEIVTGWPSFISFVLDALKVGAVPKRVPLRDHRLDLDAMLDAIGPRTKLVYVATPNNPTGTMTGRAELDAYFERVPGHVLTVVDQAYFEYIDDPDYPDAIEEYLKAGRRVLVLRTFSKIYGLAGLRVGYGVGERRRRSRGSRRSAARSTSTRRRRSPRSRAWTTTRSSRGVAALTAEGRETIGRTLREHGLRAGRPRGRELPLHRGRRRGVYALRGAAAPGCDRPAAGRVRRGRSPPDHRRHRGRERLLRRRARLGAVNSDAS